MMRTIFEIRCELLKFFQSNNGFSLGEHSKDIDVGDIEDESLRESIIHRALETLKEQGIISRIDTEAETWYVLDTPMEYTPQDVEISFDTAVSVSRIINEFCKLTNNQIDLTDPLRLHEDDIIKLISIMEWLNKGVVNQQASAKDAKDAKDEG